MADWLKPTITSNYITFVDEVKARDVDAITLQAVALVNPPIYAVKLVRMSPYPNIRFQEWNGTAFNELTLSIQGGGTGANSLAGLASNMGLGTMAYQNSNNISVTGGYLNGVRIDNPTVYGTFNQNSGAYNLQGNMSIYNVTNTGVSFNVLTNIPNNFAAVIQHAGIPSLGVVIRAGTSKTDQCLNLENGAATINWLLVRGDGAMIYNSANLAIPVGTNRFVPV
jgi:hypothetical protein